MAAVAPYAILLGALAAIGLLFASLGEPLFARVGTLGTRFTVDLEAAGMRIEPAHFAFVLAGVAVAAWVLLLLALHPSIPVALLMLAGCAGFGAYGGRVYLRRRRVKRIAAFSDQLEGALRTLAGGVRVGLGIRQALVLTSEQSREPSKTEFMRVVGLTSVGMGILDAFDQLAARMTNTETAVLARVVRVQAQTGGDLGSVLDGLAGTIRDRRRLRRRVRAITAQGRATAWLLGLLPLFVGGFMFTQGELRDAMLSTLIGQIMLAVSLALDALAIVSLVRITKIDP
ncbi:MAG: putative type secretion system integral rane subunit [Candidatus Eremiobacteraeota bacterium]|nr:putative type secretion system integral rane subunit [Candidatus Eremiobacteraeota bacterium]